MMKYGIAIFPSKEVQDEANALRKRYDPHYALVAPHITLKAGFEMDSTLRDKMIDELDEITKNVKPFKIEINKVSTFAPVTSTVYLKLNQHLSFKNYMIKCIKVFFLLKKNIVLYRILPLHRSL